jgi:hypothetical protein
MTPLTKLHRMSLLFDQMWSAAKRNDEAAYQEAKRLFWETKHG